MLLLRIGNEYKLMLIQMAMIKEFGLPYATPILDPFNGLSHKQKCCLSRMLLKGSTYTFLLQNSMHHARNTKSLNWKIFCVSRGWHLVKGSTSLLCNEKNNELGSQIDKQATIILNRRISISWLLRQEGNRGMDITQIICSCRCDNLIDQNIATPRGH